MSEKTMFGEFFLIEQDDGTSKRAERLTFGETSGRDEAWLRNTLFDHPELLPVRDIDSSFGPLIPLPLCPYPQQAHYKGSGDPNRAENFACATAK